MNAGQILDFVLENKDAKDDKLTKLVEDFMSSHKPYYHEKTKVIDACSICSFEDVESCLDKASKEKHKRSEVVEYLEKTFSKREVCLLLTNSISENESLRAKFADLMKYIRI